MLVLICGGVLFLGGLWGIFESSSRPDLSGLGSVVLAFVGFCVSLLGLGMVSEEALKVVLNGLSAISATYLLVGGFLVGVIGGVINLVRRR